MKYGYFDDANREYVITSAAMISSHSYRIPAADTAFIKMPSFCALQDTATMIFHTTQMANITISKTAIRYGIPAGSRHRPIWILMPATTVLATAGSVLQRTA